MQLTIVTIAKRKVNGVCVGEVLRELQSEGKLPHIATCIEQEIAKPVQVSSRARAQAEAKRLIDNRTAATVSIGLAFEKKGARFGSECYEMAIATLVAEGPRMVGTKTKDFAYNPPSYIGVNEIRTILLRMLTEEFFGSRVT